VEQSSARCHFSQLTPVFQKTTENFSFSELLSFSFILIVYRVLEAFLLNATLIFRLIIIIVIIIIIIMKRSRRTNAVNTSHRRPPTVSKSGGWIFAHICPTANCGFPFRAHYVNYVGLFYGVSFYDYSSIGVLLGMLGGAAAPPNCWEKSEIFRLSEILRRRSEIFITYLYSVSPSVMVTKRKKDLSRFLYHTKDHLV